MRIVDTPIEERFERITRLMRRVIATPMAAIAIIEKDRQWFKSFQGADLAETPRDQSFCSHTIETSDPLIVEDVTKDERFRGLSIVIDEPHIRAYAGVPLTITDGIRIGTLCVFDTKPRLFSKDDIGFLKDLADVASGEMKSRILRDMFAAG
ncbi:MAG: GAF domain-containing protein [Rhodoluna sp.]